MCAIYKKKTKKMLYIVNKAQVFEMYFPNKSNSIVDPYFSCIMTIRCKHCYI